MTPQIDLEKCAPIINRLTYWASLNDAELRLQCGEMTAQEIRTVRAVLAAILGSAESESQKMGTNDTASRTDKAVGSGSLVGAVRRPKNRSQWTRGYACAIATNWKHHQCPVATKDLLRTAGSMEHILQHADIEDIKVLQVAGFLSPNTPREPDAQN